MTLWWVVIGFDYEGGQDFTIIHGDLDDAENWAAQRFSHYEVLPMRDFIVDLLPKRPPSSGGSAATVQVSKPVEAVA